MATTTLQTRIVMKHDTEANWSLAENFIPLAGEVIIYDTDESHLTPRIKIGDGERNINELPFINDTTQIISGKWNILDEENNYAHIVGNGTDSDNRSNAYHLDWNGDGWFAGDVYVGSTSGKDKDEGSKKLATENYVNDLYKTLNSNTVLGFYCIEDVTIITGGVPKTYPANSNVEVKFIEGDTFEIVPTSNNSILALNAFPGALGTFYPWLEGVNSFQISCLI